MMLTETAFSAEKSTKSEENILPAVGTFPLMLPDTWFPDMVKVWPLIVPFIWGCELIVRVLLSLLPSSSLLLSSVLLLQPANAANRKKE